MIIIKMFINLIFITQKSKKNKNNEELIEDNELLNNISYNCY